MLPQEYDTVLKSDGSRDKLIAEVRRCIVSCKHDAHLVAKYTEAYLNYGSASFSWAISLSDASLLLNGVRRKQNRKGSNFVRY